MATRFSCIFPSIKNVTFKVYIDDADHAGAATTVDAASDGFTLTYDGSEDILSSVMGSQLAFTAVVTSGTEAEIRDFGLDLINSGEERFTMKVVRNAGISDELYWVGYVLPDLSAFDDMETPYAFRITATDGIARLKKIDYDNGADPAEPIEQESFITHILNCLTKGTLHTTYYGSTDEYLLTSVNWVDSIIGAPTATKCPLAYTRVNGQVFAQRNKSNNVQEWKFDSCFEVLEKIMKNWQCRFFHSNGKYYVIQIAERNQDTHFERRFSYDGTLRSSTNTMSSDVLIKQGTVNEKLTGNSFSYLPAARRVVADWSHVIVKNQVEGNEGKWIINSGQIQSVTIKNVATDADTRFVVRGEISFNVDLNDIYTVPWRYKFGIRVTKNGEELDSEMYSVQDAQGNFLQQIKREPYSWNTVGTAYYEISSPFQVNTLINYTEYVNITINGMPVGQHDILVAFIPLGAYELDETPIIGEDLIFWQVKNPQFYILDTDDEDSFFELSREYEVENDTVGNSNGVEFDMSFGSNVQSWCESKLETTSNLSTWTDSGATWRRGTDADNFEFGELWATQAMGLMSYAQKLYNGQFLTKSAMASSRLAFDYDDSAWLMLRGSFSSREMIMSGTWVEAGLNLTNVTTLPIKKKAGGFGGTILNPFGFQSPLPPGKFSQTVGEQGIKVEDALTALTANFVGSTITAGTVTSIPVRETIPAGAYLVDDNLFIINPSTGKHYPVRVSTTSQNGDTAIAINSITTTEDIPTGCVILYSVMNKQTQTGGTPSPYLPAGTVEGQTLIWNNASELWEPYSGLSDGQVLTWDTTNGWQAETPSGGVAWGSITGTLSDQTDLQTALDGKVDENAAITGATKTKITYDAKGLVTAGADAVTADIADSTNKRYVTDANLVVLGNTSGTNSGDQTITLTGDVTGSGTGSFAATIAANAVTNTNLRDSVSLSVIGRSANSTGDPADIAATVDGEVLRRSGTNLGFGTIATAGIANDAVTYAKIQNVTDARLLGRSAGSAGDVQELTVGTGLQLSGGVLSNTVTAGVTGTGVTNRLAIWTGTSTIGSDDSPLYFDGTNNRLGINTASPSATLHVGVPTGTFLEGLRIAGNLSSNLINVISNVNNVNSGANTFFQLVTGGSAGGDPALQFTVSGATTLSIGLDNSDSDKLKIKYQTTPSDVANSGITLTNNSPHRVGINNDAPGYDLDVTNTTRARTFINTIALPTVTPGTGMGTTPTGISVLGAQNGFAYFFTTGTSPVNNGTIFTVQFATAFPGYVFPVFCAGNSTTAGEITKFSLGSIGGVSFTVIANGQLTASTAYVLYFNVMGY